MTSELTPYARRQSLLTLFQQSPGIRVSDLAEALSVSEGTVRNDLNALEQEGKITRVHGGAVLRKQHTFQNSFLRRFQQNVPTKQAIGMRAAELVEDSDSIFLDASSTCFYFAEALASRNNLRVMTNGFEVARILAENPSNTVMLIGGVVNNNSSSVTGLLSEKIIAEMHIQKAFLSCSGFTFDRGMTEVHLEEAQLKRRVLDSSQQLVALIDSSKFGKEDLTPFATKDQISRLLTDYQLSQNWRQELTRKGIDFIVCESEAEKS